MGGPTKQDTEGSTSRTPPNAIDFEVLKAFAVTTDRARPGGRQVCLGDRSVELLPLIPAIGDGSFPADTGDGRARDEAATELIVA